MFFWFRLVDGTDHVLSINLGSDLGVFLSVEAFSSIYHLSSLYTNSSIIQFTLYSPFSFFYLPLLVSKPIQIEEFHLSTLTVFFLVSYSFSFSLFIPTTKPSTSPTELEKALSKVNSFIQCLKINNKNYILLIETSHLFYRC